MFFFQAEDGIRDVAVTGVQTCALPIFETSGRSEKTTCVSSTARPRRFVLGVSSRRVRLRVGKYRAELLPRAETRNAPRAVEAARGDQDRKSTRLNSSHGHISDAGFCLKKKKHHLTLPL